MFAHDVPQLRTLDAAIGRGPHFDAVLFAKEEPVGDHAMLCRRQAGRHVGLHVAGDARKARHELAAITACNQLDSRGMSARSCRRRPGTESKMTCSDIGRCSIHDWP